LVRRSLRHRRLLVGVSVRRLHRRLWWLLMHVGRLSFRLSPVRAGIVRCRGHLLWLWRLSVSSRSIGGCGRGAVVAVGMLKCRPSGSGAVLLLRGGRRILVLVLRVLLLLLLLWRWVLLLLLRRRVLLLLLRRRVLLLLLRRRVLLMLLRRRVLLHRLIFLMLWRGSVAGRSWSGEGGKGIVHGARVMIAV